MIEVFTIQFCQLINCYRLCVVSFLLASFPGSTPQLFSPRFSTRCEKSWGVEPGDEAISCPCWPMHSRAHTSLPLVTMQQQPHPLISVGEAFKISSPSQRMGVTMDLIIAIIIIIVTVMGSMQPHAQAFFARILSRSGGKTIAR